MTVRSLSNAIRSVVYGWLQEERCIWHALSPVSDRADAHRDRVETGNSTRTTRTHASNPTVNTCFVCCCALRHFSGAHARGYVRSNTGAFVATGKANTDVEEEIFADDSQEVEGDENEISTDFVCTADDSSGPGTEQADASAEGETEVQDHDVGVEEAVEGLEAYDAAAASDIMDSIKLDLKAGKFGKKKFAKTMDEQ